jgi:hypothetical protein
VVVDYEDRSAWFHPCSLAFLQPDCLRASPEAVAAGAAESA